MSQLYVDNIRNRTGGPIGIPTGAVVTGVITATTGNFTGNMTVGGVLTYEDVTNIDSTGIITAKSGIKVTGGEILVGSAFSVGQAGVVTATQFVGDGSQLTGVSGFATALSSDQTSVLNRFFKTPEEIPIGAGTSVSITSDDASGNVAFCREGNIHVAVGATFHIGSGTTLATNVLGVF